MTALEGFRIVDLSSRVAGRYAARLLADFGAEVIAIEPPEGCALRRIGPFASGKSTLFEYLSFNKHSMVVDLAADRLALDALLADADALIHDQTPDWATQYGFGPEAYPRLVRCHITPYGQTAPAEWQILRSANVMNAGGWAYHTPSETPHDKPPLKGAGRFMSDYEAGLEAALATAASLWRQRQTGAGQFIDISEVATQISRADCVLGRMLAGEAEPGPERTAFDMGGPGSTFACADGHVFLVMTTKTHWQGLCTLMGQPAWTNEFPEDWLEFQCTPDRVAAFRQHFSLWLRGQTKAPICEAAQRLGVALVQVNTVADLLAHPQYVHRGYFKRLDGLPYPTVPYLMSGSPARVASAAPALGSAQGWTSRDRPSAGTARHLQLRERGGPLAGVRVLEVTKVWAGPYAGKLLAFLGAEVIKVESLSQLDEMRAYGGVNIDSAPYFLSINQEVLSVQVNMKSPEGLDLLRKLIAQSDVLIDNLRPGAMERLGLGYADVTKVKPEIIQASIKMYGADGPLGYQTGYAPCFAALGGLTSLVGHRGMAPKGMNIRYGDSTVGTAAAFAVVAALHHRASTGEGQFVDVSAVEAMSTMIGDSLLSCAATGIVPTADENAHEGMLVHDCFPCANGEWISIAAGNETELRALRDVLAGLQPLTASCENDCIATFTRTSDAADLADRLRKAGVPTAKSMSSLDLISDGFHWDSELFRLVHDQAGNSRPIIGPGWKMTPDQASITHAAPALGEHNTYVYQTLLGMSVEEVADLKSREVIQ